MNENVITSAFKLLNGLTREKTPQAEARMAICRACPFRQGNGIVSRCSRCGCVLEAKTKLPGEHCPEGWW